ncbi:MAG: hypothetical protein KDE34_26125 [Anaerolineales bacterium]|nr:hypothetical protein [Anaerolineales bacterium]
MGWLDGLLNPTKNTQKGYKKLKRAYGASINDFNQTRSLTDPFFQDMLSGGRQAYGTLADLVGVNGQGAQSGAIRDWQMSPAFQSVLDRGQRTIDQGAAARGTLMSGDAINASREYGQDLQNQEFDTQLGRLGNLVNYGQAGASGMAGNSRYLSDLLIGRGNAQVGYGQAKDQGNQIGFQNIAGIAGTVAGLGAGPLGSLAAGFGQNGRYTGSYNQYQTPVNPYLPTYYGTGGVNPYGVY